MNQSNPSDDRLNPLQDRAIDVLLEEVFGNAQPHDFSDEIMLQLTNLSEQPAAAPQIVLDVPPPITAPTSGIGRKQLAVSVTLIVALAASLLILLSVNRQAPQVDPSQQVAQDETGNGDAESLAGGPTGSSLDRGLVDPSNSTPASTPRRGIPLVLSNDRPEVEDPATPSFDTPAPRSQPAALALVSTQVESDLQDYWSAIGIKPSSEAAAEQVAARLSERLNVKLPAGSLSDPESIEQSLRRPRVARAIAERWLRQVTEGGSSRLQEQARDRLVEQIVQSIRAKASFDAVLTEWTSGQGPEMSSFYNAVSASGEHHLVRRLASLTMNVDLRCVRCHDSMIQGNGRQADYWSFAAALRHGLKRQDDRWSLSDQDISEETVFYPLMDGRQRVATPSVSARWLDADQPITSVPQWSRALAGSPELARGVVNSLWQLVHGQPLRGRVVDVVTAPHHESLDQLEQRLTDDLLESQFDLGRTLALIIASPVTRRSVPAALLPENTLMADNDQLRAAIESVNAFAGVMPARKHFSLDRRIDIAMQKVGARLEGNGNSILANPGDPSSKPGVVPQVRPENGGDFPGKAADLPVPWLASIDDQDSRIEHLCYLSGMSQSSPKIRSAVEELRKAEDDEALVLNRVWWILRP